jgi:uncharacterized protein YjiS (DUF1127 family)
MRITSLLTAFAAHWSAHWAAHRHAARARRIATRELAAMFGSELGDMGITRLDVSRLFEPRLVAEFRSRGSAGGVATTTTFKSLPPRSAAMTSRERLV